MCRPRRPRGQSPAASCDISADRVTRRSFGTPGISGTLPHLPKASASKPITPGGPTEAWPRDSVQRAGPIAHCRRPSIEERKVVVQTEDAEDSLDRWASTEHVEPFRVGLKSRSGRDEDPHASTVDEVKAAEIEQNLLGVACLDPVDLCVEPERRGYVQLAENLNQMCRSLTFATNREQSFLKQAALGAAVGLRLGGVVVQAGAIQRGAATASCHQLPA